MVKLSYIATNQEAHIGERKVSASGPGRIKKEIKLFQTEIRGFKRGHSSLAQHTKDPMASHCNLHQRITSIHPLWWKLLVGDPGGPLAVSAVQGETSQWTDLTNKKASYVPKLWQKLRNIRIWSICLTASELMGISKRISQSNAWPLSYLIIKMCIWKQTFCRKKNHIPFSDDAWYDTQMQCFKRSILDFHTLKECLFLRSHFPRKVLVKSIKILN